MLLAPLLLACLSSVAPAPDKEVRAQFLELFSKKDHDACLALWKAHPDAALPTIDADLEGSLKLREKSDKPDAKAIAALHARALWGAQVAFEASGDPLILDYASAFVDWNDEQRTRFREGQAAFRSAMTALKEGDSKAALEAGVRCLERASALGDWWGAGMGFDAIAAAQRSLGNHEKALDASARARAIYHGLGLLGDEYAAATAMADLCLQLKRKARGQSACQLALALARKLGDTDGEKKLLAQKAALEALEVPSGPPAK